MSTGLPSWVPDWRSDYNYNKFQAIKERFIAVRLSEYKASARSFVRIRSIHQGEIGLRGILFSSCAVFGKPNTGQIVYNFDIFKSWTDLVHTTRNLNGSYAKSSSTTYYDAYWQTLCASMLPPQSNLSGIIQFRTTDHSYHQHWYEVWCNANRIEVPSNTTSSNITEAEIHAFSNCVIRATKIRKLFISKEEGWLGLAPMDAEVGDRIAILEGGSVPYILRQKCGQVNGWEIIGDAYVHGIMDGEGWNPDELVDIVLV
jgi:hypothetical protein